MEDKEIIEMICLGNEKALERLQGVYGRMMYYASLSVTKRHEDAEECCNECLYILWKSIPNVRPNNLSSYIKTVICRLSMDKRDYNLAQKRCEFCRDSLDENKIYVWKDETDCYVDKLAIIKGISNFLGGLSEEKLKVFTDRYGYDYLVKDIAKSRNVSVSKVKMMLFRMKKELEVYLNEENIFL